MIAAQMSRQLSSGAGRLAGRSCVVTGATGMAAAAARRFTAEGADVFVISIDAAEAVGDEHGWAVADLADEDAAVEAFAAARKRLGRLDALFAVAGGSGRRFGDGPLHDVSRDAWDATFALNATTSFLAAREAVRWMLDQPADGDGQRGSIVLMSSVSAFDPSPWFATHAYAATKAAIVGLMRTTAGYYAEHGIRVNALAPATVDTPMAARAAADAATVAHLGAKQPLAGGLIDPDDVAAAALYLCSRESRMVTGQTLTVDAGWSVR